MRKGCPPDCPDRSAEPNCHTTCEIYAELVAEFAKRKPPASEIDANGYLVDTREDIKRGRGKKRRKRE